MALNQCPSGHVYDDQKNPVCPYCSGSGDVGVIRPLAPGFQAPQFPKTVPIGGATPASAVPLPPTSPVASSAIPRTMPLDNPQTNKTVALNVNDRGIDPVRGWLVCLEGDKKGKDFRIHGEKNSVGRSGSNDICLDFDDSISKEANAVISYDSRNNQFFIQPGDGKNNLYINDHLLLLPVELHDYDVIEIGRTKLLFRSLCNPDFTWT